MNRNHTTRLFASFFFVFAYSEFTRADTIYVDASQTQVSPAPDGTTWATAFKYLQDALAVANIDDVIKTGQGIYHPDDTFTNPNTGDRTVSFVIRHRVIIEGGYYGIAGLPNNANDRDPTMYLTILSGDLDDNDQFETLTDNSLIVVRAGMVTTPVDSRAELDGFIIEGGHHFEPGGDGAGLFIPAGSYPLITNCVFRRNAVPRGYRGGGVFVFGDANLESTFLNCTIEDNLAGSGGGLAVVGGKVRLEDCIIQHNEINNGLDFSDGDADGAGFSLDADSDGTFLRCQILGNRWDIAPVDFPWPASGGGGAALGSLLMKNCLVADNVLGTHVNCQPGGGGIHMTHQGMLVNGRFERNIIDGKGGCFGTGGE